MIYLSLTGEPFSKIINSISSKGTRCKVLFLSPRYDKLRDWKSQLENQNFKFIHFSKELHETSRYIKPLFLKTLGDLATRHNSPSWWGSRVAERNTLINHLFLNCCYLNLANKFISKKDTNILILIEQHSLLQSLKKHCKNLNIEYLSYSSDLQLYIIKKKLTHLPRILVEFTRQSLQGLRFWKAKNIFSGRSDGKPCIILHTHLSQNNREENGSLKDIHFPGLRECFAKNNYNVVLLPVFHGFSDSMEGYENLTKYNIPHINPFNYFSPVDYFLGIIRFLKSMTFPDTKSRITLNSLDCTHLFKSAKQTFYPELFRFFLYLDLFKKLKKAGFQPKSIISGFENMVPEKLLSLGFRKVFPESKVVGFQHGVIWPNFLSYSISDLELPLAPLPDKILCNGLFFREQLAADGFPMKILSDGPALRYKHLFEAANRLPSNHETTWDIFCPLPLMIEDCRELLLKVCKAYNQSNYRVCIKPHPIADADSIPNLLGVNRLPANMQIITNRGVDDLIRSSRVVVGLASSTLFEAVCMGVEVIVISRDTGLNFNPLEYFPDINKVAYSEEDLEKMTLDILNKKHENRTRFQNRCEEIRTNSFTPTTEEAMRSFFP